jgi:hypothetical protein
MVNKLKALLVIALCLPLLGAWPNSGKVYPPPVVSSYTGPGDVLASAFGWWGLRAYSAALAGAGATTTPVVDVLGSTTVTSCTIYLKGDGTGGLDLTTSGTGGVGHQCISGATTFCTVTNTSCSVSQIYDQSGGNHCGGGPCPLTQATAANQPVLTFNSPSSGLQTLAFTAASTESLQNATINLGLVGAPYTFSHMSKYTNNSLQAYLATVGATDARLGYDQAGTNANKFFFFAGIGFVSATASDGAFHDIQVYEDAGGFAGALNVDGTDSSGLAPGNSSTGGFSWGVSFGTSNNPMNGNSGEIGVWEASSTSTIRNNLCHNQSTYWGVASC